MHDTGTIVRLLGQIRLDRPDGTVDLGPAKQRAMLAALLLTPGSAVPGDVLVDRIWGERPPQRARNSLATYATRLRRLIDGVVALHHTAGGYVADCAPELVDLHRARGMARAARAELAAGAVAAAAGLLRGAVCGWQDDALAGISGDWAARVRSGLQRERLDLLTECLDIDLRLGRDAQVIDELHRLVVDHPTEEPLVGRLMTALARAGRSVEALNCFAALRAAVGTELGAEPSAQLRELHVRLLRDDPELTTPAGPGPQQAARATLRAVPGPDRPAAVPAQLPAYAAVFNGRDADLGRLAALRRDDAGVVALTGPAGVGKTTLAVHWAHRIRADFPDGQLYVNLNGYSAAAPTRPLDALAAFLVALGVAPDRVPVDGEQAAALYRSLLADRRMLVVLDNAREPDQVRPLLPGARRCLTVITSRDRLSGLVARDSAARLSLDVLSPDAAAALLSRVLGPDRVAAEPAAAAALAEVCGGLPLALRISAAHLLDAPDRPISDYLGELRAGGRVRAMAIPGDPQAAVGSAFDLSYQTLPHPVRRLFRLLALAPGLDIGLPAAAALASASVPDTARLLDRLAAVHLVSTPGPGRWAMHDLVREYAAGLSARHDGPAVRTAALARLFGWYRYAADAAAEQVHPEMPRLPVPPLAAGLPAVGFDGAEPALAWLGAERDNLVAAVRHAAAHGPLPMAWLLADTLRLYFWLTQCTVDWLALAEAGTAAAVAAGDTAGRAAMALTEGTVATREGRFAAAAGHYETAARLAADAGWLDGEASARGNAGEAYFKLGEPARSRAHRDRSAELYRRSGKPTALAMALVNQGYVDTCRGRLEPAAAALREAHAILEPIGAVSAAHTALSLADTERILGNLDLALRLTEGAMAVYERPGFATLRQLALAVAADVLRDAGRLEAALAAGLAALKAADAMAAAGMEGRAHRAVGDIYQRMGIGLRAAHHYRESLRLARDNDAAAVANAALIGLARLPGPRAGAVAQLDRALAVAERGGYRIQEGDARTVLAEVELAAGNLAAADTAARAALAIFQEAGGRPGVATALLVLGRIALRAGDPDLARRRRRRAEAILAACGCDPTAVRELAGGPPASATG